MKDEDEFYTLIAERRFDEYWKMIEHMATVDHISDEFKDLI